MEEYLKKAEGTIRNLAVEIVNKVEKKKKLDLQDVVVLATYLNLRQAEETREQIDRVLRAFNKLDELIEVVKELRAAVQKLQKETDTSALREVSSKLDEVLARLGAYTIEES
ncbi:MAG: hypothetical protein ABWK05_04180 [Pyrobaculum sp.]